jgi:hypothetical protein
MKILTRGMVQQYQQDTQTLHEVQRMVVPHSAEFYLRLVVVYQFSYHVLWH